MCAMSLHLWGRTLSKHAFLLIFYFIHITNQTAIANQQLVLPNNHTVEEAYKVLGISPNPDGSMTREIRIRMVNATPYADPTKPAPIALSKDVKSSTGKTCMRLFRPLKPPANRKLPLIIYMHGGDFVLFSATTIVFQKFCNDIAAQIPAVVVSVEYRLAPEHRLPAAYDDAMSAVFWVRQQALGKHGGGGVDPWLTKYADFKRVFLLGSASGGNIAYHTALRTLSFNLQPMQIKGLFMNQPYFSGVRRTSSEIRLMEDPYVPLYVNYVLWTLALPPNATRDHEFCNPVTLGSDFGRVKRLPRTMVKGNTGDPLVDRGEMLVKLLKANGVEAVSKVVRGGYHGVELNDAAAAQELYDSIKAFVLSTD